MDLNKEIMKEFMWFDSAYLLRLMSVWLKDASYNHLHHGHTVSHKKIARKLKIMQILVDRLAEDDYFGDDIFVYGKVERKSDYWKINERNVKIRGKVWAEWKNHKGSYSSDFTFFPDEKTYRRQAEFAKKHNHMQRDQDKALFCKMFKRHLETLWD